MARELAIKGTARDAQPLGRFGGVPSRFHQYALQRTALVGGQGERDLHRRRRKRAQPARAARACAECAAGRRADGLGNVGCRAESGGGAGSGGATFPPSAGAARLRRGEKHNKQAAALAKPPRLNTQETDFKKKAKATDDAARKKADEKESKSRTVEYAEQTAKKASADSVATERRAKRSPEALGKRDAAMIFKHLAALKKKKKRGATLGGWQEES